MFQPYQPTITPVKVYRASDIGAPQLKAETGSLKTLLKTCLVNGYGEGANRKEPAGWKITDETANDAIFYSDYTYDIGLKVENSTVSYVNAYMVGGEQFVTSMNYANKAYDNFAYGHSYARANWLLVACDKGFMLVLPENNLKSQILYFGRIYGIYEDSGNIAYINTSNGGVTSWDNGTFDNENYTVLQIVRSQWRDGGTSALAAVGCKVLSPFSSTAVAYPDALYQNTTASAIVYVEKNGAVRGTLPALFWCYHNLQNVVNELDWVEMADGQQYIKLNLHDGGAATHCFVLNIQEWVL